MPRASFEATVSSDSLPTAKLDMSSSDPPQSRFPAALGPGARPVAPGASTDSQSMQPTSEQLDSLLSQVREIRSHYSVTLDDARSKLNLSYDLRNRHRAFSIPFETMPLSALPQWLLYGGPARRLTTGTFVTDIIRGAENMAQRDLTQVEAEGHACHASRRMLYSLAAMASSLAIGAGFTYTGMKTMKFPLRKPKPIERYDNFPNRYLPILKGQFARTMWHITRWNIYSFCAFLLIQPIYSSMGDNAMMVGLYRDIRTNAVLNEMKALKDPNRAFQISRIGSNVERGSKQERGQVFASTAAQREKLEAQRGKAVYEDSDPQGYYNDSGDDPATDYSGGQPYDAVRSYDSTSADQSFIEGTAETGMLTDRQMAQREARQTSPSSFTGVPSFQKARSRPQQHQEDQSNSADDFFDDASPSGGRGMTDDISSSPPQPQVPVTKSGMGGAWTRVRKGEQTPHSSSRPETTQNGSTRGSRSAQSSADSFSFTKSDEERQLAKEQAQRDFDRMVEAERRGSGGDGFTGSGGGGGGSAWGRGISGGKGL